VPNGPEFVALAKSVQPVRSYQRRTENFMRGIRLSLFGCSQGRSLMPLDASSDGPQKHSNDESR